MLLNVEKHITLPGTLKNNTLYLIKNGSFFDILLTNSSGTATTYLVRNALLTGSSGGQTVVGGTAAGESLTVTSNAQSSAGNKGKIYFGSAQANYFDEANGLWNIVAQLLIQKAGTTGGVAGLQVLADVINTASDALYILPPANGTRIFFGKSGLAHILNFSNVTTLENVPNILVSATSPTVSFGGSSHSVSRPSSGNELRLNSNIGSASFITFYANAVERARIDPSGLKIGTTTGYIAASGVLSDGYSISGTNINGSNIYTSNGLTVKGDAGLALQNAAGANMSLPGIVISTTDATQTTIQTIAIGATKTVKIDAVVGARRTGGTATGNTGDAAFYKLSACYKNVGGTVSLVGAINTETNEDVAAWDAAFVIVSTNVLIRVTGAAATNITWQLAEIKVYSV